MLLCCYCAVFYKLKANSLWQTWLCFILLYFSCAVLYKLKANSLWQTWLCFFSFLFLVQSCINWKQTVFGKPDCVFSFLFLFLILSSAKLVINFGGFMITWSQGNKNKNKTKTVLFQLWIIQLRFTTSIARGLVGIKQCSFSLQLKQISTNYACA